MPYGSILVGTDGSATATKAVDKAVALAQATGSSLTVMHIGRNAAVLDDVVNRHRSSGVDITTTMRTGDPASVLVEAAEDEGYGLLVVGNRGMTDTARFFLGSVPNKVSHHARCSLLIVRTT